MNGTLPKFGNSCNPRKGVISEIETIADMGFDFAELTMEAPNGPSTLWKHRNSIKNALKKYGIFATAHAPLAIDLGNFIEPARHLWIEQSLRIIAMAKKIGVEKINFHANYSSLIIESPALKDIILENHVKSLKILADASPKYDVKILLENTHETLKNFCYIAAGIKRLFVTLDVGHAFIYGGNAMIRRYIKTFDNISHLHLHDNNGERDEHLAIGHGKIDFPALAAELKKRGFDGTATLEVFTRNRALAKVSLNKIKKIWSST